MTGKNPKRVAIVATLTTVAGAAAAWSAATQPSKPAPRNEADVTCKLDGKMSSIGAVIKDEGRLYRCTSVLEERGVTGAAWVQVEMTTSIVVN